MQDSSSERAGVPPVTQDVHVDVQLIAHDLQDLARILREYDELSDESVKKEQGDALLQELNVL